MNLHYLVDKRHWRVEAHGDVYPHVSKSPLGPELGVGFPAQTTGRIVVRAATQLAQFQNGVSDIGWTATLLESSGDEARRKLALYYAADPVGTRRLVDVRPGEVKKVELPSMLYASDPFAHSDLIIEAKPGAGAVFIGTSRKVDRNPLYRLAKGRGCEIGPGPRPQIHSSDETEVYYIEEKSPEEWRQLYRPDAPQEAWDDTNYLIGKAHDLPFEDGSLDFIFSSHVLEHLYNPLGHFDHWRKKLKPGGLVLGVVPATDGTKDFVHPPTSILALVNEHAKNDFAPPIEVYEAWAKTIGPEKSGFRERAAKLHAEQFSIHVHTYDDHSFNALMRHLVEAHGFADYRVRFVRNSKDFVFAIKADASN